jgi:murein L,D-transpeptidase YcbB/YkuD
MSIRTHAFNRREWMGASACALAAACSRSTPPATPAGQGLTDPVARRFYAGRNWTAVWDKASAQSLGQAIAGARAHGLDPRGFMPKASAGVGSDEACTLAALALAKALAVGLVDPRTIEPIHTLRRNHPGDLAAGLAQALAQGSVAAWLGSLAPTDPEYKALSAAYIAALAQTVQNPAPTPNPPTAAAMAPIDQARQLAVNLERRRWLSRTPPAHRIDVNIAGAVLTYRRPGTSAWWTRTVVGKPDHPTPSIEAAFHKLIANPPWKVPKDIAEKEILPKGPGYMAKEDMRWGPDGLLEQAPGPKCALGVVKFDVEDPQDIYLHDTPDKWLFALPDRHRSHGCVRVDGALDFARSVAAETGKTEAFDQALASGQTGEVDLGQTIAVRMLYHSAWVDPTGHLIVAPDAYGLDDQLSVALGLGHAPAEQRANAEVLFGP